MNTDNLTQEHLKLIEMAEDRSLIMPEFKITHFVGNAQITPYAKLRQYLIELNSRQSSVESMEYEVSKLKIQIELEKEKAEETESKAQRKLHELETMKLEAMLKKSELRLRDATKERNLFLKVIDDFNKTPEAFLPDGRKIIDIIDDPDMANQFEREHWTLRLAKQTAMDMIAYGRAGVGNMDAVTMLDSTQQLEVMKLAVDFFVRNEIRQNALLGQVNKNVSLGKPEESELVKQLMFKQVSNENVSTIQNS
ncbi:MAG: hypothetical protein EBU90_12765 [Proteobacteria bacterium]|nr:hypothetical protein [Pseudomonadota bacterium]NBP14869.1 hypothetical protein [bacterium]